MASRRPRAGSHASQTTVAPKIPVTPPSPHSLSSAPAPHTVLHPLHRVPNETSIRQRPRQQQRQWILSLLSSSPCPLPVDAAAGGQRQRRYRRQAEVLARPVREAVHVHADPARRSPVRLPAVESQRSRLRFGDVNSTGSSVASVVSNPPPPGTAQRQGPTGQTQPSNQGTEGGHEKGAWGSKLDEAGMYR